MFQIIFQWDIKLLWKLWMVEKISFSVSLQLQYDIFLYFEILIILRVTIIICTPRVLRQACSHDFWPLRNFLPFYRPWIFFDLDFDLNLTFTRILHWPWHDLDQGWLAAKNILYLSKKVGNAKKASGGSAMTEDCHSALPGHKGQCAFHLPRLRRSLVISD